MRVTLLLYSFFLRNYGRALEIGYLMYNYILMRESTWVKCSGKGIYNSCTSMN